MRRLRASDGTTPHRRAAQFHLSKCQMGKAPIHAVLYTEMKQKRDGLIVVSRKVEDAEDVYVGDAHLPEREQPPPGGEDIEVDQRLESAIHLYSARIRKLCHRYLKSFIATEGGS